MQNEQVRTNDLLDELIRSGRMGGDKTAAFYLNGHEFARAVFDDLMYEDGRRGMRINKSKVLT